MHLRTFVFTLITVAQRFNLSARRGNQVIRSSCFELFNKKATKYKENLYFYFGQGWRTHL